MQSQVWDLCILPPLIMRNQLPLPVKVSAVHGFHSHLSQEGGLQELPACSSAALLGLDPAMLQVSRQCVQHCVQS